MDACRSFQLLFCGWQLLKYIVQGCVFTLYQFICLVVLHFSFLGWLQAFGLWQLTHLRVFAPKSNNQNYSKSRLKGSY